MRGFAALYPKSWRARYGEEFDALLAQQRHTPGAVIDLLLGALDAHLTGDRGGSSVVSRWRTPGALSFTVGGLIWFAGDAIELIGGALGFDLLTFNSARLLVVAGELIVAFGVIDHARGSRRGSALSLATATAGILGLLLGATTMLTLVLHTIGISTAALSSTFLSGTSPGAAAFYAAMAVFALVMLMRNLLPRPPLAALAAASCGLAAWAASPSPIDWIQAARILYVALPLCWLVVGLASLVFRPSRVEVALK